MKSRIKYTDEPMGRVRVIRDFLPPPEQLVAKENKVKITISLSKSSIDFFKKEAKRNRTSYQKMIRRVVDSYASHYQGGASASENPTQETAFSLSDGNKQVLSTD